MAMDSAAIPGTIIQFLSEFLLPREPVHIVNYKYCFRPGVGRAR